MKKQIISNNIPPKDLPSHVDNTSCSAIRDYSDIQILKKLSNSKFPIFLASSPKQQKHFAMKMFPHKEGKVSQQYLNEARFITLNHPNIVSIVKIEESIECSFKDKTLYSSYVLMELALNDFIDLLPKAQFHLDERLSRTYFSQLIAGIEYLHSQGVAHMDIKGENLLLGSDYQLKITDFDLSHKKGDVHPMGKGTVQCRAPELLTRQVKNPMLADIYSAGVVLFILRVGHLPYDENGPIKGFDLQNLMFNDPEAFWDAHDKLQPCQVPIDQDFKDLFISMVQEQPDQRISIEGIKTSNWFRGNTYNKKELAPLMANKLIKQ